MFLACADIVSSKAHIIIRIFFILLSHCFLNFLLNSFQPLIAPAFLLPNEFALAVIEIILRNGIDAIAVGHAHVEQKYLGATAASEADGIAKGAGNARYGGIGQTAYELRQAFCH
jgi:hypothetical protein